MSKKLIKKQNKTLIKKDDKVIKAHKGNVKMMHYPAIDGCCETTILYSNKFKVPFGQTNISDYEMKEYPVYTYQTLDYFNKQYPQDDIYFICGVDNLSYMNEWKHPEVIKKYPLLVLERGNVSIPSCNFDVTMVSFSRSNISSTLVREKVKHKESILSYVPKTIADYILKYQLYKE